MFAILGLVFPFLKAFLGDGIIEKMLNHKRELAASANERERMNIEADVKVLSYELERRKTIRDLQVKEYEHWALWWPKFLIMMSVAWYWFCVFMHATLGLADFAIVIPVLTPAQEIVSSMVLGYMFLDGAIKRVVRK
jgi:hypothetical protein